MPERFLGSDAWHAVEFMSLKVWEPIRTGDINLGLIKASEELKLTEKRRIFIIL